jgi:hypothetical protein
MIVGTGSGRRNHDDETAKIAAVVHIFARANDTAKGREVVVDPLQILGLGNFDKTDDRDSEETDDCDSEEPDD